MRKGNETEIEIRMKMPGNSTPTHIPGVLIREGMTEREIEHAMTLSFKFIVERLCLSGAMRYFPKEPKRIVSKFREACEEGLEDPPKIDDGY